MAQSAQAIKLELDPKILALTLFLEKEMRYSKPAAREMVAEYRAIALGNALNFRDAMLRDKTITPAYKKRLEGYAL